MSDLPTFTPSTFPPSVFNYARPRHFIQSQSNFQAPSYESVQGQPQNQPQIQTWNQTQAKIQCQSVIKTQSQTQAFKETQSQTQALKETQSQTQAFKETQSQTQAFKETQSQTQAFKETQSQTQAFKETQSHLNGSSKSTSLSSNLISTTSYQAPSDPLPPSSLSNSSCFPMPNPTFLPASSSSTMPTATVCSTITLIPRVPSATGLGSASLPSQPEISSPAAFLCSVLPSQASQSSQSLLKQSPDPPQIQSLSPVDLLPSPPGPAELSLSNLNQHSGPKPPVVNLVSNAASSPHAFQPPSVVSFPDSYRKTPDILPKPIMRKPVTQCPSNRSTDEEIQGSKDALIQDLEKKLRCKEAHSRNSQQKLSYEERMARRLLGPDNASYVLDMENPDSQLDQPDSPEGRHSGGLWGKHHSGTKHIEGSAIQEKRYAPRFLQVPQDLTVEEGRFCRIDFKVCGLPTPDVSWYLDGKAIRPDDYHKMLVCENNVHSFIIEIVTVHHTGVYECVARNRAGETSFTMKLDVIAQEVLLPPTFVQKMLNSHALEGDTVRLECKVEASPPPKLFWKKDKDMLRIDPHRMSLYQDGSGRQCLLIERVMKTDAGWYTLSAINSAGLSTCNARLDIGIRPPIRKALPGSKSLKLLSSFSQLPVEPPKQHAAPLFESEEL